MLYKRDVLFNVMVVVVFLLTCSYLCYQFELMENAEALNCDPYLKNNTDKYEIITYYDVALDYHIQDFIRTKCKENNVDIELVLAVMKVESNYQFDVISSTHDYGIMQINEVNHDELKDKLNVTDFLDPYDCSTAGIYMLSSYKWCKNETQMLMCYNMGVSGAKKAWNKGIYETNYTKKVLKAKKELGGKKYEVKILCD